MNEEPNMPKVTPGPIIGLVVAFLGVASAVGLPISDDLAAAIITLAGALAVAIPGFEAWLRRARLDYLKQRDKESRS